MAGILLRQAPAVSLLGLGQLAPLANLLPRWILQPPSISDLFPSILWAVPKHRTTHSAKRMRNANKGLKEQQAIVDCLSCGLPKRSHHICHNCHTAFRQELHKQQKDEKKSL